MGLYRNLRNNKELGKAIGRIRKLDNEKNDFYELDERQERAWADYSLVTSVREFKKMNGFFKTLFKVLVEVLR